MKQHIFLDLEETIINTWDNPFLMNVENIRAFISQRGAELVHIFSFAVWDENDQDVFDSHPLMKDAIAEALDVEIGDVPSLRDVQRSFANIHRLVFKDKSDFLDLTSKELGFIAFCRDRFSDAHCILIDDKVEEMTIDVPGKNLKIELFNVANIGG